jgi:acyl carrier protein
MTEEQFMAIVASALEVEQQTLSLNTKMYDIENWDSLGQLAILTALAEETDDKSSELEGLGSMVVLSEIYNAVKDI